MSDIEDRMDAEIAAEEQSIFSAHLKDLLDPASPRAQHASQWIIKMAKREALTKARNDLSADIDRLTLEMGYHRRNVEEARRHAHDDDV